MKSYKFVTDSTEYTETETKGEKKYFVQGYISTKDRDLVDDIVTESALSDMLKQLQNKNIKLDVEHEAWREENPTIIPIGKILEAKIDEKGIWVKAEINSSHNRFKEVWNSIKNGFLDAFSIAFKTKDYVYKLIDGVKTRLLNSVELLNVALTGNPANPECRMVEVFTKSLTDLKQTEENKMANKEVKDEPDDEVEEEEEEKEIEEPEKEEIKETKEIKTEEKEIKETEIKDIKGLNDILSELKDSIKSINEKLDKPMFKSKMSDLNKETKNIEGTTKEIDPLNVI